MDCPVCLQPFIVIEHLSIELDYCFHCKGLWFDAGELELLLEKVLQADRNNLTASLQKLPPSSEGDRRCPRCSRIMDWASWKEVPDLVIDCCPQGHGLWFDAGELESILTSGAAKCGEGEANIFHFLRKTISQPPQAREE